MKKFVPLFEEYLENEAVYNKNCTVTFNVNIMNKHNVDNEGKHLLVGDFEIQTEKGPMTSGLKTRITWDEFKTELISHIANVLSTPATNNYEGNEITPGEIENIIDPLIGDPYQSVIKNADTTEDIPKLNVSYDNVIKAELIK